LTSGQEIKIYIKIIILDVNMFSEIKNSDSMRRKAILSKISNRELKFKSDEEEEEEYPLRSNSKQICSAKDLYAYAALIHSYSGEDEKYTVHQYFHDIEKLATVQELNSVTVLYIAQIKLKDKALQIARRTRLLDIENYSEFKDALIQRFHVSVDEREARSRFFHAQMKISETVAEYAQRIELDAVDSIPVDWPYLKQQRMRECLEDQILEVFLEGLRKDLYNVRFKNPKDFPEALIYAKEEEKLIASRKRRSGINTNFAPDLSGKQVKYLDHAATINNVTTIDKERSSLNFLKYPVNNIGAKSIPTRDCAQNADINDCFCHLRRHATFFTHVFETRLCTRECKIHNKPPPQNLRLQSRSSNDNLTTERREIIPREQERPVACTAHNNFPNFTHNTASERQKREQYLYICDSCGHPGHARQNCQHYNAVCHNCHKFGHISQICKSPPFQLHDIQTDNSETIADMFQKLQIQVNEIVAINNLQTKAKIKEPEATKSKVNPDYHTTTKSDNVNTKSENSETANDFEICSNMSKFQIQNIDNQSESNFIRHILQDQNYQQHRHDQNSTENIQDSKYLQNSLSLSNLSIYETDSWHLENLFANTDNLSADIQPNMVT
jgi:Retrotransposon gag protein